MSIANMRTEYAINSSEAYSNDTYQVQYKFTNSNRHRLRCFQVFK